MPKFTDKTYYSDDVADANSFYCILGKLCIANVMFLCVNPRNDNSYITEVGSLPAPALQNYFFSCAAATDPKYQASALVGMRSNGQLYIRGGEAGARYLGQIIYPIA